MLPCVHVYIGVEIQTATGTVCARAMLLIASFDLPARALVMNMKQFNGKNACLYCEQEGTTEHGRSLHRWWPYEAYQVRTHDSLMAAARQATLLKTAVSIILYTGE